MYLHNVILQCYYVILYDQVKPLPCISISVFSLNSSSWWIKSDNFCGSEQMENLCLHALLILLKFFDGYGYKWYVAMFSMIP